jgi:C_GCAxxG_C_C family probable redox protein
MSIRSKRAVADFNSGFNCAQSVFASYAEDFGINRKDALRISCGLGGGMGRKQEICGAVSGAVLLIGCKHGKTSAEDTVSTDITYKLVREFSDRFAAKHGNIICKKLLGCDLLSPEGQKTFKDQNMKESKCNLYVNDAVEITEGLLGETK